ncbi:MAG: IS1595 family transposase [Verrucomicrobiota bacterium]|nr:IS1595 family transposase [Verrucomicrobiota bacterium]
MKSESPQTLQEAIEYFDNAEITFNFMVKLRWPNGACCPRCGDNNPRFIQTRKIWECRKCKEKKQFSVKVGTIFEDSALPLNKWLTAIWLIANAKNGVSSYEIHRALGVTQKTGWFMLQRIRLAMQTGTFEKFSGIVEADETYIGGLARNMHVSRNRKRGRGTGGVGKQIVMGLLERGGKVKAKHVPNARRATVQGEVRQHVAVGSHVFTDALASYAGLNGDYIHKAIDHAECYVKGNVHTNGLENFWCLLKRCIKGTYVSVEPFHLFRYLDEEVFRYNNRKDNDGLRFLKAVDGIAGRRLTYKQLTGDEGS